MTQIPDRAFHVLDLCRPLGVRSKPVIHVGYGKPGRRKCVEEDRIQVSLVAGNQPCSVDEDRKRKRTCGRLGGYEHALDIATDPDEWAEGYEAIIQAERDMMREGPQQWDVYLEEVAAFREGSVGWGAGRGYAEIEGTRVRLRITAVVHQENGEWKRIQSHTSIGVPNGEVLNPIFRPQTRSS